MSQTRQRAASLIRADAREEIPEIHTVAFMTAACGIYEQAGFRRCPEHDLRAADIRGLDSAGEVAVIAYRLDIATSSA